MDNSDSELVDALEAGIIASGMTITQAWQFCNAFSEALGVPPPTQEDIELWRERLRATEH